MKSTLSGFEELDYLYTSLLTSLRTIAEALAAQLPSLDDQGYDSRAYITLIEAGTRALQRLVEIAPFHLAKQQIEATEAIIDWLFRSTQYIGEERQQYIEMLMAFQAEVLQAHQAPSKQGTLL